MFVVVIITIIINIILLIHRQTDGRIKKKTLFRYQEAPKPVFPFRSRN